MLQPSFVAYVIGAVVQGWTWPEVRPTAQSV